MNKRWGYASLLPLAVVGLVTYYDASRIGLVNNDWYYMEQVVRRNLADYLAYYFDPRLQSGWYRPGFGLLYLVVYALFGASTAAHHWAHVVLHIANALFLFALIRRFTRAWRVALIAPLVYVGLPVYSKAVYWISVPDPLAVFISFIALWFWVDYLETEKARDYVAAFIAFAAALISKETSIVVPAIFLLMDRLLVCRVITLRALILRYAPFALVALPYLAIELNIQKSGMYVGVAGYGVGPHMLPNLIDGLAWSVFPVELPAPFNYLWLALVAIGIAWWMVAKKDRRVVFLAGVAIVPLLPVIGFTPFWFERRYMYITTMAAAILFAGIIDRAWAAFKPRALYSMLAAGAIGLVAVTNFSGVNEQIASWGEIARQRRVPFRDIVRAHPTFPDNTYLYFLDSPIVPLYDLSVMFLLQYGKGVVVEGASENQVARWNEFANAYVYYFDSEGRPTEIPVERAAQFQVAPALPVDFSAAIRLEDWALPKSALKRGEPLPVLLYWRALGKISEDYTVFVHLVNERGEIIAQQDAPPKNGNAPTSSWGVGQLIVDAHVVTIPIDAPAGSIYRLEVGLYDAGTMRRLEIRDLGDGAIGDTLVIQPFRVE